MADCTLRPDETTQALMQRFDLRLRQGVGQFELFGGDARLASLLALQLESGLKFELLTRIPAAAYYTDMRKLATYGDFFPCAGGELLAEIVETETTGVVSPVMARLVLLPQHLSQTLLTPMNLRLALPERRTFWKYLLVGGWKENLQIVDTSGEVNFAGPWREILPDGREIWFFRSLQAIGLRERPPQRFQLCEAGEGGRVLVDRLPLAAPYALTRESVDGICLDVSEVFLNR